MGDGARSRTDRSSSAPATKARCSASTATARVRSSSTRAELEAHALAPAPDGGLYVGTSPDGKIYKVDRRGTGTTFFEPGEKYIWALATDARGQLYAATGDKGVIYKIAPDGKGAKFYQAQATNVTALAVDPNGNLLVGTESPGRVLRVDSQGKAFLLLDTPFEEIRSLRFDDKGVLYVAAVNGRTGTSAPPRPDDRNTPAPSAEPAAPTPVVSVSTEITAVAVVDTGSGATAGTPREDRRSLKGAVYRIAADGLWDKLWESREDSPYDVIFDAAGHLIVATGNRGKLYRLEGDPLQPTLLATAGGQQVTALHRDARGQLNYATANPGKVYRLSAQRASKGTYDSATLDAGMVSSWGSISWRGSTPRGSTHRDFDAVRQLGRAKRHLERVVRLVQHAGGVADREPESALPAVARRPHRLGHTCPDLGQRVLPAAQPAAPGAIDHVAPARDRVPETVQHRRPRPRRLRRSDDARSPADRRRHERCIGRIRLARRGAPDLSEGAPDADLARERRERRRAAVRRAVPP